LQRRFDISRKRLATRDSLAQAAPSTAAAARSLTDQTNGNVRRQRSVPARDRVHKTSAACNWLSEEFCRPGPQRLLSKAHEAVSDVMAAAFGLQGATRLFETPRTEASTFVAFLMRRRRALRRI
jgi:hypothetical protein